MDIVYICREGDNEELRYSIRSIEKNFPGQKIWVAGYKPDWYSGLFISIPDTSTKFNNIRIAMFEVAEHPEVSDDFVFMNDDFFLIEPITEWKTYNGGLLSDKINRYRQINPTSTYVILLKKTFRQLRSMGIKTPLDYDIHVPMIFNKIKLLDLAYLTFQPRSLYGNLYQIASEAITDVKRYASESSLRTLSYTENDYPFISTEDKSFEIVKQEILGEMFPEPSKYEVPLAGIEPATKRLEGSYSIH
jgi:hypothetical protein